MMFANSVHVSRSFLRFIKIYTIDNHFYSLQFMYIYIINSRTQAVIKNMFSLIFFLFIYVMIKAFEPLCAHLQ